MKETKTKKRHHSQVFREEMIFDIFDYCRCGMSMQEIGRRLGVSSLALIKWKRTRPLVKMAIERGREIYGANDQTKTFTDYVYKQLPDHLQKLWREIQAVEASRVGRTRVMALLDDVGKRNRQHLFMYAYCRRNFNASRACHALGISYKMLGTWKEEPEFAELLDELHWHKKNFFEDSLIRSVRKGETAAVIFANKTLNRDRGYQDKTQIEVSGTIEHKHGHIVSIESLGLDLATQRLLLERLRLTKEEEEAKTITVAPLSRIAQDVEDD